MVENKTPPPGLGMRRGQTMATAVVKKLAIAKNSANLSAAFTLVPNPNAQPIPDEAAEGTSGSKGVNLAGRHLTALEKFEFDQRLREVVTELLQPAYERMD